MAKPSKYSRARIRSRVRRPKKAGASRAWSVVIGAVIMVGILGIVFTKARNDAGADVSPKLGEHWHAYLGVNVCGNWLGPAPEFHDRVNQAGVRAGLHSHGDNLIHMHPFSTDEAGKRTTLGKYFGFAGWSISSESIQAWDAVTHANGGECGTGKDAKPAELSWIVGKQGKPWPAEPRTGNPSDYRPQNGDIVAIYYLPKGDKLEKPPGADEALTNISDVPPEQQLPVPAGDVATTTTAAGVPITSTP